MNLSIVASASFKIFVYRKRKEENSTGEDRKRTFRARAMDLESKNERRSEQHIELEMTMVL